MDSWLVGVDHYKMYLTSRVMAPKYINEQVACEYGSNGNENLTNINF
jgi:hypothetical protein